MYHHHTASLVVSAAYALLGASMAFGQGLSLSVTTTNNELQIVTSNGTPGAIVVLALDPRVCSADVTGDRRADASDVTAIQGRFGPCATPQDKIYDLDNDGFINDADVVIAQASACVDVQSTPIPGCSSPASVNANTATIISLIADAQGRCSLELAIASTLDAGFYFQAVELSSCMLSPLVPYRVLGGDVYVAPTNQVSCVVHTDFYQPLVDGLVSISTDREEFIGPKTAVGQVSALADASPGASIIATLGETPCAFSDAGGDVFAGVALGLLDTFDSGYSELASSRIQHLFQPVAFEVEVGTARTFAPFSAVWELVPPFSGSPYTPFMANIAALPTRQQAEDVLDYYAVPSDTLENTSCVVVVRVAEDQSLGQGAGHANGFGITLRNFSGFQTTPYVASRHLSNDAAASVAPTVSIGRFDGSTTSILIQGELAAGDHWFLLSDVPFSAPFATHLTNPPQLAGSSSLDGGAPCGTPEPPANPPAVGGAPCQGGMGLLWSLSDCVLTSTHFVAGPVCADLGPFLAATAGGAPGVNIKRKVETSYKGSATISVNVGGVGVEVGTEIDHTGSEETDYTIETGNGCGQNLAWYVYEKHCLTRYYIKYHTLEWIFPVCWCCECCIIVDSTCKAGSSTHLEVCNRDC